ncbi:MAG: hypothetical protein ACJ76Z_02790 [Thermoleophilaceae bacterium]
MVAGWARLNVAVLHHNCTTIPDIGEPMRGSPRAGFCTTFDRPWAVVALVVAIAILGVAAVRRRTGLGAAIYGLIALLLILIPIVGSHLDAVPPGFDLSGLAHFRF